MTPEECAFGIRRKYGLVDRIGDEDLDAVCAGEGLTVESVAFAGDVREVYMPRTGRLGLRAGMRRPETRWLTAHGLAHHLMHRGSAFSRDLGAVAQRERAAEMFAGYFLLGLWWVGRQPWELAEFHAVPQERVERFIGLECAGGAVSAGWCA